MEAPEGYTVIEFDLYQAARVGRTNLSFLDTLNLRTIIVLDSGAPSRSLAEYAESRGIKLVHLVTEVWRSVNDEHQQMMRVYGHALRYVLDSRNYPVLILGSNLIAGVIRRLENWSFAPIMSYYTALAEVTDTFLKLSDIVQIETMEFVPGKLEGDEVTDPNESLNPLKSVVVVDLPTPEFRPPWVKNYGIDFER